jgi:UDP-N-acetylglucosamine 4,6-dehydratase/5-epimerase
MKNLSNKIILITGGTGSFGNGFVNYVLKNRIKFKKIVILSRDEYKLDILEKKIPPQKRKKFRFFLGDIRDKSRLVTAFQDIDLVIHAAALKQVPRAEFNPFEFIQTNILGSQNVISAALQTNVQKVIALSTDKASSPANLYGATKLCADKLFIAANNIKGWKNISFSVLRYGNVFGSRGSIYNELAKKPNNVNMTDENMTRFHITLEEAIKLCFWTIKNSVGGEIIVPKLSSYRLIDFIHAICPKAKIVNTGIRPGEKIHEEMISVHDSINTLELNDKYLICNEIYKNEIFKYYAKKIKIKKVGLNFSYSSEKNIFLNIKQIKKIASTFKI